MRPTPICDFAVGYAKANPLRLHMPGHKGRGVLGVESLDITEIDGADDLYHAHGIIAESERNAASLFGCPTFYSTEGSSLCIRAMLFLAVTASGQSRPLILAGRNAHKSFLNTAILLDFRIQWLAPAEARSYHSCSVTARDVEAALAAAPEKPCALYLTSPDYLGGMAELAGISRVCREHGILLLVDNAHGAYLRFLSPSRHPMDLGADLCCDSAHKTLPVLTGGAYLHIRDTSLAARAKEALALFGSTSPSYLILQSLDAANPYMDTLPQALSAFLPRLARLRDGLTAHGFLLTGEEPLKITLSPKAFGYTGTELAGLLAGQGIFCEFADPDYIVFMFTPENTPSQLTRLENALCALPRRDPIPGSPPLPGPGRPRLTPREAAFARHRQLPVEACLGRILGSANVACPPAIPIVMCGEEIDEAAVRLMRYYGVTQCTVVQEEIK